MVEEMSSELKTSVNEFLVETESLSDSAQGDLLNLVKGIRSRID